jgi:hypothetical protein
MSWLVACVWKKAADQFRQQTVPRRKLRTWPT